MSFCAVAETRTCLFGVSTLLLTAVIVTTPVLVVAPAAMVSTLFVLSVKSSATAGEIAVASTVTVVVALDSPLNVAVTVLTPPLSLMDDGVKTNVTLGCPSSSIIVPIAVGAGSTANDGLLSLTVNISAGSSFVSPVTGTVMVLLVSPALKVSVPLVAV